MAGVTADHDLQRGVLGAGDAAANGRIEHLDTAFAEHLMDAADEHGRAGRQIGVDGARLGAGADAVRAEGDLLDLLGAGQGGQHELGLARGVGRRLGPAGAMGDGRLAGLAAHVVDQQVVSGALQVGRHARAHHAQADESDAHRRQLTRRR
jgi:hypothetical protein